MKRLIQEIDVGDDKTSSEWEEWAKSGETLGYEAIDSFNFPKNFWTQIDTLG